MDSKYKNLRIVSGLLRYLSEKELLTNKKIEEIIGPRNRTILTILESCITHLDYDINKYDEIIELSIFLETDLKFRYGLIRFKEDMTIKIDNKEYYCNNLDSLKYIFNNEHNTKECFNYLCLYGNINIIKVLLGLGESNDKHDEIVNLFKKYYKINENCDAISNAAKNGHNETIKLLKSLGASIDDLAIYHAARNGYNETIKLLKSYGAPINKWAINWAAHYGHCETVKLLKSYGVNRVTTYYYKINY